MKRAFTTLKGKLDELDDVIKTVEWATVVFKAVDRLLKLAIRNLPMRRRAMMTAP